VEQRGEGGDHTETGRAGRGEWRFDRVTDAGIPNPHAVRGRPRKGMGENRVWEPMTEKITTSSAL